MSTEQPPIAARISRLYRETGEPGVKWTLHAADGTWLGYAATLPPGAAEVPE